jgi:uncharacterized membrane protein
MYFTQLQTPFTLPLPQSKTYTHPSTNRWVVIDLLRGCALLAMLITHSAWRIPDFDYRAAYGWDTPLIPDLNLLHVQLGWLLQGSSPVFFLLAGFAIAFFCQSRYRKGWTEWQITRFLLLRGLVLVTLDLTLMNIDTEPLAYGYRLSVLTAMGINLAIIACLRWLSWRWLALLAGVVLLTTQWLYYWHGVPQGASLVRAVLLAPGGKESWLVLFPALPWLPVMLLGFISGELLAQKKIHLPVYALMMAGALFILWFMVDMDAGFGNLYPQDPLIFGKHPPDLAFLLIYLSGGFLFIGCYPFLQLLNRTFLVRLLAQFGQTSLFFYVVHTRVLMLISYAIPYIDMPPALYSMLLVGMALPILFMLCLGYQKVRTRYPNSLLKYF